MAERTNRVVYIIGHIPPTIGSYRHTQLWQERYLDRYYEIVTRRHCSGSSNKDQNYNSSSDQKGGGGGGGGVVKAQLFGHIHTDEFRIVHDVCPIYLTSSFTPIYGSNPSFRVVTYDSETGDLLDYHVQYLDLAMLVATTNATKVIGDDGASTAAPTHAVTSSSVNTVDTAGDDDDDDDLVAGADQWKQGASFTDAYQVSDMSLSSLKTIVEDLQNSTDHSIYWEALLQRLHVYTHGSEVCDAVCRMEWACTLTSKTAQEYDICLYEAYITHDPVLIIGVFLLLAVVLATIVVAACRFIRRCRQRRHYQIPDMEVQLEEGGKDKVLPEMC